MVARAQRSSTQPSASRTFHEPSLDAQAGRTTLAHSLRHFVLLFALAAVACGAAPARYAGWEPMPLGLTTLAELANTAAFLASDQASAMTGTVVNLSGGAIPD